MNRKSHSHAPYLKGASNSSNKGASNSSNRGGSIRGSSATHKNIPNPVHEKFSNEQINQVLSGFEVEGSLNIANIIIIITPDLGDL